MLGGKTWEGWLKLCMKIVIVCTLITIVLTDTLIAIVFRDYNVAFFWHCWLPFILWWACYVKYEHFWQEGSVESLILGWKLRPTGLLSSSIPQKWPQRLYSIATNVSINKSWTGSWVSLPDSLSYEYYLLSSITVWKLKIVYNVIMLSTNIMAV